MTIIVSPQFRTPFNLGYLAGAYGLPLSEAQAALDGVIGTDVWAWVEGHKMAREDAPTTVNFRIRLMTEAARETHPEEEAENS